MFNNSKFNQKNQNSSTKNDNNFHSNNSNINNLYYSSNYNVKPHKTNEYNQNKKDKINDVNHNSYINQNNKTNPADNSQLNISNDHKFTSADIVKSNFSSNLVINSNNNSQKAIIKNIYPIGILKLNYEIKYRKKEFLDLCMQYDSNFSSYVDKDDFREILDIFTCYLKLDDQQAVLNIYLIDNSYINYIDISSLSIFEEIRYSDPFLVHLNEKINIPRASLIDSITKNKHIDVTPIEELNKRISEENFRITICKKIMEFIVIHSQKMQIDEYLDKLFLQLDFDKDGCFTVGEFFNFITLCKVNLPDHELRFLFESIKPENGRISKNLLKRFFYELYQKTITKPANTNFIRGDNLKNEILTEQEKMEESKIMQIMDNNEFIKQILDSIHILGKTYLIKYFSKFYISEKNKFMIDTGKINFFLNIKCIFFNFRKILVWLELGYKKLNYREIPSDDVGKFKFFCVLKNIGVFKEKLAVYVDIEYLIDFISKYFSLEDKITKKDSMQTIEGISEKLFKDISKLLISYGHTEFSKLEKRMSKKRGKSEEKINKINSIVKLDYINDSDKKDVEKNEKKEKPNERIKSEDKQKNLDFNNLNRDKKFESFKLDIEDFNIHSIVNEFKFRRGFINNFGFVDHFNLDHMINKLIFSDNLFDNNKKKEFINLAKNNLNHNNNYNYLRMNHQSNNNFLNPHLLHNQNHSNNSNLTNPNSYQNLDPKYSAFLSFQQNLDPNFFDFISQQQNPNPNNSNPLLQQHNTKNIFPNNDLNNYYMNQINSNSNLSHSKEDAENKFLNKYYNINNYENNIVIVSKETDNFEKINKNSASLNEDKDHKISIEEQKEKEKYKNMKDVEKLKKILKPENSENTEQSSFKVRSINNKNWLGLGFNLIFMSLIKFHDQVGLLLDANDISILKNVYSNMEKRIFPKQRITNKKTVNINIGESNIDYPEDIKSPGVLFDIESNKMLKIKNDFFDPNKKIIENTKSDSNNINSKELNNKNSYKIKEEYNLLTKEKEKVNKISDENFINENIFAGYLVQNNSLCRSFNTPNNKLNNLNIVNHNSNNNEKNYNININAHVSMKERSNLLTSADSAEVIPELYSFCSNYLIKKFNLEKIDFNILRSIGVCKIFREHLKEKKIDTKIEIDYLILVDYLKELVSHKCYLFLEYFGSKYKDKNNKINIQFFFAKMEEVLLQYSKIEFHNK